MKVGVIDTSGTFEHKFFNNKNILCSNNHPEEETGLFSHAEYVCAAILKQCPEAEIHLICLEKKNGKYVIGDLIDAISYLVKEHVFLINVSMGIEKGRNENLEEVIEFADRNGVYIVAAHSNRDVISYPASLKTVIGVRASKNIFQDSALFKYRKSDNDIIFPYSYTHFEQLEIPYMVNGNSFLAPTITGIITRFHQAMPDIKIDDLLEIVSKTVGNSFIPNGWFKKDILHVTFTRKKYIGKKLKIKDSIFVKNLSELNKKISNIEINPKEILFMQFEKIVEDKSDDLKKYLSAEGKKFLYIILSEPVFSFYDLFEIYAKEKILIYQGGW